MGNKQKRMKRGLKKYYKQKAIHLSRSCLAPSTDETFSKTENASEEQDDSGIQKLRSLPADMLTHKHVARSVEELEDNPAPSEGLDLDNANSDVEDMPGTSSQNVNQDSPCNEIKVFCPKCNTEVPHTAEGMQQDQTKILIAKVYHYFEHEYEELKKIYGDLELTPLSKFGQRTALATGVSETTVLQILKEEEERNANKEQELPEKRKARKRSRQTDSLSEEDSSDDNLDDGGQSSFTEVAQNEPEIETLVVKLEPPEYKEQAEADPISIEVKAEPPDHGVNSTNETLALSDPAGTKHKARKIPKTYTRRQHTQGESSTAAAASSVRLTEELDESGLSEESEVKEEKIEICEEGFS